MADNLCDECGKTSETDGHLLDMHVSTHVDVGFVKKSVISKNTDSQIE